MPDLSRMPRHYTEPENDAVAYDPTVGKVPVEFAFLEKIRRPLTPRDVDLRHFSRCPIDVIKLFGSRFHSIASRDAVAWRAGVMFWLKSWHQVPAGTLPGDDLALREWVGLDAAAWSAIRETALRGWKYCVTDGLLYHTVMADLVKSAISVSNRQRAAAHKRWGKRQNSDEASKLGLTQTQLRKRRLSAARKRGTHTGEEWQALVVFCGGHCVRCHSRYVIKDHIIPLHEKDSSDSIENIQPLCRRCNSAKGNERVDYRAKGWVSVMPAAAQDRILARLRAMAMHGGEVRRVVQPNTVGSNTDVPSTTASILSTSVSASEVEKKEDPVFIEYPCTDEPGNEEAPIVFFDVRESKVEQWQRTYPKVDVRQALRELRQWAEDTPGKRKTPGYALHHLNACLQRRQRQAELDIYRSPSAPPPAASRVPDYTAGTEINRRSFLYVDD